MIKGYVIQDIIFIFKNYNEVIQYAKDLGYDGYILLEENIISEEKIKVKFINEI